MKNLLTFSRQAPSHREPNDLTTVAHRAVLLVKRSADASLMAGMWELPLIAADAVNGDDPVLTLRHSITDTDYRVAVFGMLPGLVEEGRWFSRRQCERLPLTGLARKILTRVRAL